MDIDKENVIKNLKIGITKELYNKKLLTQRQLQYAIDSINDEHNKYIEKYNIKNNKQKGEGNK